MAKQITKITIVYSDGSEVVVVPQPSTGIHTADDTNPDTPPTPPHHPE